MKAKKVHEAIGDVLKPKDLSSLMKKLENMNPLDSVIKKEILANEKVSKKINELFEPKDIDDYQISKFLEICRDMLSIINADTYEPKTVWAKELENPSKDDEKVMDLYYKFFLYFDEKEMYEVVDIFNSWVHTEKENNSKITLHKLKDRIYQLLDKYNLEKYLELDE
jgi:hypothetical protein